MLQRGQRQALGHDAKGPRCSCRSFESLLHIIVKCDGLASFESSGPYPWRTATTVHTNPQVRVRP